jgi:hypothetical protein
MNYSLVIMVLKEMVSMESRGSRVVPVASPLLSLQSIDPFIVFRISPPPHRNNAKGGIYSQYRSRRVHGGEFCDNWTHEVPSGTYHVGQVLDRIVGPILALVVFPVDFFFSSSSIS